MTKQEILDRFSDIDFVYNNSSKHETLSRMLDELLKEQEAVMEWKDARREMPDKQGDYLVFIPGEFNDTMMVARYSFNCEIPWRGAQAHSAIEDILLWMPLPKVPKERR